MFPLEFPDMNSAQLVFTFVMPRAEKPVMFCRTSDLQNCEPKFMVIVIQKKKIKAVSKDLCISVLFWNFVKVMRLFCREWSTTEVPLLTAGLLLETEPCYPPRCLRDFSPE